jgi:hypothetical protein
MSSVTRQAPRVRDQHGDPGGGIADFEAVDPAPRRWLTPD